MRISQTLAFPVKLEQLLDVVGLEVNWHYKKMDFIMS
jgi:hypothetical protein